MNFVLSKDSTELLTGDNEIQDFADTLVRSTDEGGCGIKVEEILCQFIST